MLFWFETPGNAVQQNSTDVIVVSVIYLNKHGTFTISSNFRRSISLFCARSVIKQNWINDQDRYMGLI
jgi:hypothetical protein